MGAWLSAHVSPSGLRRSFGVMVIGVAAYVLSQAVTGEMVESFGRLFSNPQQPAKLMLGLLLLLVLVRIGAWIHKADRIVFTPSGETR